VKEVSFSNQVVINWICLSAFCIVTSGTTNMSVSSRAQGSTFPAGFSMTFRLRTIRHWIEPNWNYSKIAL